MSLYRYLSMKSTRSHRCDQAKALTEHESCTGMRSQNADRSHHLGHTRCCTSADRLAPVIGSRMSTCDRFEPIGANGFSPAMGRGDRILTTAILPRRRAHDPLEGRAEGAFGFVAE